MNLEDRIIYATDEILTSVENALDTMDRLRYDGQFRNYLGNSFVNHLETWENNIRKRKNDPFTLVVIGDFKRGKSTFINALLGAEVVTTDVTTETVTFNRLRYGAPSNEAILSGNRRLRLTDSELKKEELEAVLAKTNEPITELELKRPFELLRDVTIIDTPGTGDAMFDFSEQVENYLLQADAVVYLYSVKYPLSQTEQMFLKSAVLPQQYTKLFIVGNYADAVGSLESYDKIRTTVTERIHNLIPDAEILTLSALDELCKELNLKRPCQALTEVLEQQFAKLRLMLTNLVKDKKETVLVDRMQRMTHAMLSELKDELKIIENGLEMSKEEAKQKKQELQNMKESSIQKQIKAIDQIDSLSDIMYGEANEWMLDFVERLREETKYIENIPIDDIFKDYSFYCVDLMQEAMNTCFEYHREKMFTFLEENCNAAAKMLLNDFHDLKSYNFRFDLDNKVWTKGDNIGFAISLLSNTGMLASMASLVADGLGGHMRQKEVEHKKSDILNQIFDQMNDLEVSIATTTHDLYDKLKECAKKVIIDYFDDQLKYTEELVDQSIAVANSEDAKKENIRTSVEIAKTILKDAENLIFPMIN